MMELHVLYTGGYHILIYDGPALIEPEWKGYFANLMPANVCNVKNVQFLTDML